MIIVLALATVAVGIFSLQLRAFDIVVCMMFGIIGYMMLRFGYAPAAAGLTAVLSTDIERNFRLGLILSDGSIVQFVTRPYTALILAVALAVGFWGLRNQRKTHRSAATGSSGSEEVA